MNTNAIGAYWVVSIGIIIVVAFIIKRMANHHLCSTITPECSIEEANADGMRNTRREMDQTEASDSENLRGAALGEFTTTGRQQNA